MKKIWWALFLIPMLACTLSNTGMAAFSNECTQQNVCDVANNAYACYLTDPSVGALADIQFLMDFCYDFDSSRCSDYQARLDEFSMLDTCEFTGGEGSSGVVEISDCQGLSGIRNNPDGNYIITKDIDCSATINWNNGKGWEPISGFTGTLNGNGHKIYGLRINRINDDAVALFASTDNADIHDVHLKGAYVAGDKYVGTLIGSARTTNVSRCSATGNVVLKSSTCFSFLCDSKSGGLLGSVSKGSMIKECYSEVGVDAKNRWQVGGLVGYLRGRGYMPVTRLDNSYSGGTVIGTGYKVGNLVGDADGSMVVNTYSSGEAEALIGYNYGSPIITNSFWDMDTSGISSIRYGGMPAPTEEMKRISTFLNAGWSESTWLLRRGDYPRLHYENLTQRNVKISNCEELWAVRNNPYGYYELTSDIDCTGFDRNGIGFPPIYGFGGELHGNGHSITGLYFGRPDKDYVGLFGSATGSTIKNVHLINATVFGNKYVGALIGAANYATIEGCSASGTVYIKDISCWGSACDAKSGGMFGSMGRGTRITKCASHMDVYSGPRWQVGSLVGYFRGRGADIMPIIEDSYADGMIHYDKAKWIWDNEIGWWFSRGAAKVGGLVGDIDGGIIRRSYYAGEESALYGYDFRFAGIVEDSFYDADLSGSTSSRKAQGITTSEMKDPDTFLGAGWLNPPWILEQGDYPKLDLDKDALSLDVNIERSITNNCDGTYSISLNILSDTYYWQEKELLLVAEHLPEGAEFVYGEEDPIRLDTYIYQGQSDDLGIWVSAKNPPQTLVEGSMMPVRVTEGVPAIIEYKIQGVNSGIIKGKWGTDVIDSEGVIEGESDLALETC